MQLIRGSRMRPPLRRQKRGALTRRDAGFGIPEAMFSMVILTTAMLGLAATAIHAGGLVSRAHRRTDAMAQVRIQVEELLAQPYDSVAAGSGVTDGVDMDWAVTTLSSGKEITLVYEYQIRGRTKVDTLTAVAFR